jgi:hypothetical protein
MRFEIQQRRRAARAATNLPSWQWVLLDDHGVQLLESGRRYATAAASERAMAVFMAEVAQAKISQQRPAPRAQLGKLWERMRAAPSE